MMKSFAASHLAKSAALCICPVVGAGVVATQVPQARKIVHKITSPKKPVRVARRLPAAVEPPCIPTPASQVSTLVPAAAAAAAPAAAAQADAKPAATGRGA